MSQYTSTEPNRQTDKFPQCLRELPQWVLRDAAKVPHTPAGSKAKCNDRTTWSTYEDCLAVVGRFAGLGFQFSVNDEFVGIDLDGCRDPETREIEPWALEIIIKADSYSEVSPSGTGVKIIVRGDWVHGGKKKALESDGEALGKQPGIEVYSSGRYFALTGERLDDISPDVEQRQGLLNWMWDTYFDEPPVSRPAPSQNGVVHNQSGADVVERARRYVATMPPAVSGQHGHDALFSVACRLVLGFELGELDSLALLHDYNQRCSPPWSERELQHKVKQAAKQTGDRGYLRNARPDQWSSVSIPHYEATESAAPITPLSLDDLFRDHPRLSEPLIDGLLRFAEVMNVIAASKFGKSWLVYGLAMAVATGTKWLGRFQCRQCRVLIIDNELHPGTLASRIKTVADAMGVLKHERSDRIDVLPLRGDLKNLYDISAMMDDWGDRYGLIICDAFYRVLPQGMDENSNGDITALYNTLDRMCQRSKSAWVNIHHASKGSQGGKAVTDVGSGAGAQSRAADSHLILREHEDDGCAVLEGAVRSFPPVDPLPLRWVFPVWVADNDIDAKAVKGRMSPAQEQQRKRDAEGMESIVQTLKKEPATARVLRTKTKISRERLERLLDRLEAEGRVHAEDIEVRGNPTSEYRISTPSPLTIGMQNRDVGEWAIT